MMTTTEVLIRAKANLTAANWGQGHDAVCHGSKRCMLTAIGIAERALGLDMFDGKAEYLLKRVCLGGSFGFLSHWNDRPDRTLQEVYDAFDAAIAIAQQQERADRKTTSVADDVRDDRAVAVSIG